ncbi:MAG: hypothetical protein QXJ53_04205 [Candidatus Bathyarchaeia archaeon]
MLIVTVLETVFIVLTVFISAYLVRHGIFTLTVLKNSKKAKQAVTMKKQIIIKYQY